MTAYETRALFEQLEATVEENLDRHLAAAEDWMPHEYVPWSEGRNFAALAGEPWSAEQSRLSPVARTALELNLLTEDNLPSYHRELRHTFGRDGAWDIWVNRWTAEEGRHASCIRDYLVVTRGVDPESLERARMATLQAGWDSGDKPLLHACAYVSFQELATRVSHRNTGRYCDDPVVEKLLARIAMDENLHMIFYRNLVQAALEIAPSQTLRAIADEVAGFVMPGSVVPGFARKAVQIARAGIYDLRVHHDDVIMPLLRHWRVLEAAGLDAEGEQAQRDLAAALEALNARATRFVERRAEAQAEQSTGQNR
jgi:acyl-[acyl-carrier-protein] desaturase